MGFAARHHVLLRHNDAVGPHPKAAVNTIWRMEDISTPALSQEAGYVTPNVNTLYGFGFLDLAAEPVILSVPDSHAVLHGRDRGFLDQRLRLCGRRRDRLQGRQVCPGWPGLEGKLPPM